MKIVDLKTYKEYIDKLDNIAQVDMTKPELIFPQKKDESIAEKMQKFFDLADGNGWKI